MRFNTILAAMTVAAVEVLSYDADIHPEFQEGLSINDVPADRRLHWMRVANEVSHDSSLVFTDIPGGLCQWTPMSSSSLWIGNREHHLGRIDMCYCECGWNYRR